MNSNGTNSICIIFKLLFSVSFSSLFCFAFSLFRPTVYFALQNATIFIHFHYGDDNIVYFLSVIFRTSDMNNTHHELDDYSCDRGCLMAISITFGCTTGGLIVLSIAQLIYIVKRPKGTDVCV